MGGPRHTVRGAMAGALKKELGLTITPEKIDGRRVYRIVEDGKVSTQLADLLLRFVQTRAELGRELLTCHCFAVPLEVGRDLAEHVVLPWLLKVGVDDLSGIGLGSVAVEAELLSSPQSEHLVAPG